MSAFTAININFFKIVDFRSLVRPALLLLLILIAKAIGTPLPLAALPLPSGPFGLVGLGILGAALWDLFHTAQ